jgi:hypothetical protein
MAPSKEPAGSLRVVSGGDEHVDDLPDLVDRAVDLAAPTGDLHLGRIDLPAVTDSRVGRAGWPR